MTNFVFNLLYSVCFRLLEDKLSERIHEIKVLDYKMLSSGEFLNDILMEFYME